ncbi:MAG: 4-hydroxyphenylpyruvate dioxygenase [Fidelibacterota bacterium]
MAVITKEWLGKDYFPDIKLSHVEFFVSNAKQVVHYYRSLFGFQCLAYAGPETGCRDHVSYVLRQHKIVFIFTTPLSSRHPASRWIMKHGDGVFDIAFQSTSVSDDYQACLERGAVSHYAPEAGEDESGSVTKAGIRTYGDTIHSFIDRSRYSGLWVPGFIPLSLPPVSCQDPGLITIDHIVGNVNIQEMDVWKHYYETVFGFTNFILFDEGDISTKYSALKSRVMRSKNWRVLFPINEPAAGLKKSQIEEYLEFNEGPGVQHIALLTGDILHTIRALRANGVEFLFVPDAYYDELSDRVGAIDEALDELRELGLLVDRDDEGYLLQLFSKPVEDRPTLFYEIIQRKGSRGFGQGNFQALFESIEKEQERRGNL